MVIVPPVLIAELKLLLMVLCAAVCLSGAQEEGAEWKVVRQFLQVLVC